MGKGRGRMDIIRYENYHESKRHGDYSFPYTTYICTIPLDFPNVPLHWHEELEFIYIKQGMGSVTVNMTAFDVSAGTIILVLPGQLHSISQLGNNRMEYENILFHADMLISSKIDSCNRMFFEPLFNGEILFPTLFIPGDRYYSHIAPILDECDRISEFRQDGYQLLLKSRLLYLFYEMNTNCRIKCGELPGLKDIERLKSVLKYIEHHYHESISIDCISEIASYSPSHFMRLFKETLGKSFTAYLIEYRLTMAARLLRGSDNTILEVASEVGFDNVSYFSRSFRKQFGITPGSYRKQHTDPDDS